MVLIDVEQHAFCFELLANKLRLDLLRALEKHGQLSAGQLASIVGAERTRVSHALALLKECRLVTAAKAGRRILYTLNQTSLFTKKGDLFTLITEHAKGCINCARKGGKR